MLKNVHFQSSTKNEQDPILSVINKDHELGELQPSAKKHTWLEDFQPGMLFHVSLCCQQ